MLKTTILNILSVCHRAGRTMPRDLLKREAEMQHGGQIGDGDFDAALGGLQDDQFVASGQNPVTHDRTYYLTDKGAAL